MTMTKFSRINKQREEITMRVLEDMEKGGNEWKKPWVEASPLPPHNPVSGTQYSGRNFLYTYVYGMMRGYADPRWATEKQIKEMGWKVPENLQNERGGINDELGVGIEHWGMYAYIPRVKKDGTPLTDKGGTQKFTRVRAVKENGVWGRYRKGDNGKYEFARLLEYKCAERGRTLVKVGRFYPSSKTCSACGHRLDVLPLSVRSWDCPVCGAHHDRDVNAARNILTEGKRILSNTQGTAGHAGTVAAITA